MPKAWVQENCGSGRKEMTNGVLMFAHNNETTDYEALARLNEKLVKKFLDVPVHIVTGEQQTTNIRSFTYNNDYTERVSWHNTTRMNAYDLSPFDNTLLLDVDYFILSDNLKFVFDMPNEFICQDRVYDVTYTGSFDTDKMLSNTSFPMRWATCVYFKKTPFSKAVFEMMGEIKDNYLYYSHLFNFRSSPYRNDFALSIALQILSGYQDQTHHFHFPVACLSTQEKILEFREDGTIVFEYKDQKGEYGVSRIKHTDLHIMNKKQVFEVYEQMERYAN